MSIRRTIAESLNRSTPDRPEVGCWIWAGHIATSGYGSLTRRLGGNREVYQAHRVAYEIWVGPIPEGLVIDHLCMTKACVRPDHLEAVTQGENVRRAIWVGGRCSRGHDVTEPGSWSTYGERRKCRACEVARDKSRNARLKQERADALKVRAA